MTYTALYREWRPNTFNDIVGQNTIVKTLQNQIRSGRVGHAYLFSGPRGTGKTSTAKIFAKAVNCLDPIDVSPCGECRVCTQTMDGNTMDVIEIDAASNNGVDEIRELRDKAKFPPAMSRYKVYIIDEVHMLSTGAFNALLKTLEEPPSHVIFILATTEPQKIPATIISRCQRFDFKLILLDIIVEQLRRISSEINIAIEEEALYTIARWSEGGMRDALSLLDQCIGFCGDEISNDDVLAILGTADEGFMFEMVDFILGGDSASALKCINKLVEDGRDISVFVRDITDHMRNLLIIKTCNDNFTRLIDASPATLDSYKIQAEKSGHMRIFRAIDMFVDLESRLKWSNQPRILLELTISKLCRPEEEQDYDALLDRLETLENKLSQIELGDYVPTPTQTDTLAEDKANIDQHKEGVGIEKPDKSVDGNLDIDDDNSPQIDEESNVPKIDLADMWPKILKVIKKERIAIYSLLIDTKLAYNGGNTANLIFPADQSFYVTAIEKEDNKSFIEEAISKVAGEEIRLNCTLEGEDTKAIEDEDMVVKKAIEIFGKDHVEIVDD